jgi:hypothetical protein
MSCRKLPDNMIAAETVRPCRNCGFRGEVIMGPITKEEVDAIDHDRKAKYEKPFQHPTGEVPRIV